MMYVSNERKAFVNKNTHYILISNQCLNWLMYLLNHYDYARNHAHSFKPRFEFFLVFNKTISIFKKTYKLFGNIIWSLFIIDSSNTNIQEKLSVFNKA